MITRILSDIHFGHPASYVRDFAQLEPLLEGVPRVIFNGDSVEMRFVEERQQGAEDAAALRELCLRVGVEPVFISGNHDPFLTELHHLDLSGGSVLVTHGDILFEGVSPWSRESRTLLAAHRRELAGADGTPDLELQLRAAKRTMLAVEQLGPKMRHAESPSESLSSFLHEIWPPWRPLLIAACWVRTPGRVDAIAARCRPEARFVIIGHMHWSGIWSLKRRVVINTGSFLPFSGRYAVDIDSLANELIVRRIPLRKNLFRPGKAVARFPLPEPPSSVLME